jgi:hypothetical protein
MTPDHELDFLALQYVSDELSAETRAAFEERLLDDQAAREAVAAAVEMTLAVEAAYQEDAHLVAVRDELLQPSSRNPWWSVALACGLLLGLVLVSRFARPPVPQQDSDLAIAWSEARTQWPTSAPNDDQLAEIPLNDDDLALPSWMVAAVSESNMDMTENPPNDNVPE